MSNDTWFEAKNVSSIKNGYEVVKDLNLKLKYDENVILIGPNGSGKSSLIELINRNIYPVVKNNSFLKIFNEEKIDIWKLRKKISTVNYEIKNRIPAKLKVFDLIMSGLYGKYGKPFNTSKKDFLLVADLIKKMYLTSLSQKYFSHLSDGEKQICLIARALAIKPEFLILDEPIANLDLKSRFYIIDHINELSRFKTKIICVTHDISMITGIYNRVIMMKDRMIIADGKQSKILNSKNINNLFDIHIDIIKYKGNWHIYRKFK